MSYSIDGLPLPSKAVPLKRQCDETFDRWFLPNQIIPTRSLIHALNIFEFSYELAEILTKLCGPALSKNSAGPRSHALLLSAEPWSSARTNSEGLFSIEFVYRFCDMRHSAGSWFRAKPNSTGLCHSAGPKGHSIV
jgi:hypothetical protein